MKRNNATRSGESKATILLCNQLFRKYFSFHFQVERAPIEPRDIETISWSIPFQTFRISASLDERFIHARSLKRSSLERDRHSGRQMPVSAPIKFFDASPISFSTKFSSSSLPLPCFEKETRDHTGIYTRSLKSRKESVNRGTGDRDRNGYFALSASWSTVLFTTGSLSAKTMRLERSPWKERERERDRHRRERGRVKGKREKIVEQSRGLTPLVLFPPGGGIHTCFFFFRGWTTPLCGRSGGRVAETDMCR